MRSTVVLSSVIADKDLNESRKDLKDFWILAMLTDMTPTAGHFYGAQIPAMTMNMKSPVSIQIFCAIITKYYSTTRIHSFGGIKYLVRTVGVHIFIFSFKISKLCWPVIMGWLNIVYINILYLLKDLADYLPNANYYYYHHHNFYLHLYIGTCPSCRYR